ncbi:MAG: polysaccharide pyruvyl transferase family protein [Phycisphaeraceae bacterium]
MQIVLEQGGHAFRNVGDWAMLEVAIRRLAGLFPDAQLSVFADDPQRVRERLAQVHPLTTAGRNMIAGKGCLLGRWADRAAGVESHALHVLPGLTLSAARAKAQWRRRNIHEADEFVSRLRSADLVVASGGGYLSDAFPGMVYGVCRTLAFAQARGIPTALFGQGIGPLTRPPLVRMVGPVLRRAKQITLRERRRGPAVLRTLAVDERKVTVTGDDAVELSMDARQEAIGTSIGVNLRMTGYSGVDNQLAQAVGATVRKAAAEFDASLTPVPISFYRDGEDMRAIERAFGDMDQTTWGGGQTGDDLSPQAVIRQVGTCRLVVTASYHAAVFALAQGIPAICLVKSEYYAGKFHGLADMFSDGCRVIDMARPDWRDALGSTIHDAWRSAEALRPSLIDSARDQVERGRSAYAQSRCYVEGD